MNIITIIIVCTLVVDLVISLIADILNLRQIKSDIPHEFQAIYDSDQYKKSQDYLKVNTRFGWFSAPFDVCLFLMLWFGKGFLFIDHWARSWEFGPILTGIIYIGVLSVIKLIVSLPFGLYETFVIEERFGFNKTTWSLFFIDLFKSLALSLIIGIPILACVLFFFEHSGSFAWLYCWIFTIAVLLIIQFVAPIWILPLFNKFKPLEDGDLKDAIMSYAASVNYPLTQVFVMDGSKRSTKSNAFFTGFGKNKRIGLFDTLIQNHTISEIVAILAHEIGHYKKKHIQISMIIGIFHSGILFYVLSFFISYKGLFDAFYMDQVSVYAGLIFFGILYSPIDSFLGLLFQMISRRNEYQADRFGVETTHDPESLVEALKKLSVHNLSNLMPHPFYVFLNYSHPPVLNRINAIRSY